MITMTITAEIMKAVNIVLLEEVKVVASVAIVMVRKVEEERWSVMLLEGVVELVSAALVVAVECKAAWVRWNLTEANMTAMYYYTPS